MVVVVVSVCVRGLLALIVADDTVVGGGGGGECVCV